ncbi:MAG: hypothetical protein ABI175_01130 [Polyangiales bacterium]
MAVRSRRAARGFVAIAVASAGVTGALEASANPPAPTNWPDPPEKAPKEGAKAVSIQKHDSGCFVHFEDGGNAKRPCPKSLENEPPGESIEKSDDGSCHFMMTISWSGGSSGAVECPPSLGGGGGGGDTTTTTTSTTTATAGGNAPPSIKPAEQPGCGACTTSTTSTRGDSLAFAFGISLLALLARRRRAP